MPSSPVTTVRFLILILEWLELLQHTHHQRSSIGETLASKASSSPLTDCSRWSWALILNDKAEHWDATNYNCLPWQPQRLLWGMNAWLDEIHSSKLGLHEFINWFDGFCIIDMKIWHVPNDVSPGRKFAFIEIPPYLAGKCTWQEHIQKVCINDGKAIKSANPLQQLSWDLQLRSHGFLTLSWRRMTGSDQDQQRGCPIPITFAHRSIT